VYRILDTEYKILDTGLLDTGYRIQDKRYWIQGTGYKIY